MFRVTLCSQFTWILYTLIAFSIICSATAFAVQTHQTFLNDSRTKREADDLKIVCYYSNWAVNRHASAANTPENITPYLCAHLNRRTRSLESLESLAVTRRPSSRRRFPGTTPTPVPIVTDPPTISEAATTLEPETIEVDVPFECEDEGFFKNPKDCRKYFWCLDSGPANLGVVAHAFTCPSGLYFNTKTEACDYPQNVNCKQKGTLKDVTTKKPKLRNRLSNPTTTTTTTTEMPSTSAPQPLITPELIAEALKLAKAQSPPQNTQSNELTQLLQLVQSLGGIDKVQTLLSNKVKPTQNHPNYLQDSDAALEGLANTRTTQSFFTPSYETPNRQEFTPPVVTTEATTPVIQSSPTSGNWLGLSRNQVRSRRPQFDYNTLTTPNPPTGYSKEENALKSRENIPQPPQSPFNFVYIHPERTVAPKSNVSPQSLPAEAPALESGSVDGFFVYNTPGRFSAPSTRSSTFATETPVGVPKLSEYPQQPPNDRLTLRVSAGNTLRLPLESRGNRGNKRPMRVQVQSAFTVDDRTVPGVLYDEEAEIATHKPALDAELRESPQSPHSTSQVIARRPSRKRPPQRPHLRDNKKENVPPSIANHLPPTVLLQPQNQREKELKQAFPELANNEFLLPTPPVNPFNRPQAVRFIPTTPPPIHDVFDYSPTQISRQPFPLISPSTRVTNSEALTTSRPLRRGRPRKPSPLPTQSFQVTTPRKPTTEAPPVTPSIDSTAPEFSGPTVIIEKNGQITCGRRGVHPHPNSCAQFVVCAPGKNANTLRSYTHHCPAEQVFVKEVGRCRPGNRNLC